MILDRSVPPSPGAITQIAFPPYTTTALSNGIPVYLVENHGQPLVSISLYIRGGSSLDTAATQGLASLTAELLTKGTAKRTATQIAEEIDFVGGSLGVSASWDSTTISTSVLSRYIDRAIDLLSDVALNPAFSPEEVDRIRIQRIASIKAAKSDAGYLADVVFSRSVYGTHPYGFEAAGQEVTIALLQSESLKNFYSKIAAPNNAFFIVAGDVIEADIVKKLSDAFGAWAGEALPPEPLAAPAPNPKTKVVLVEKPQAVQSALRIGHLGVPRSHKDYVHLYVLNMLLGGYFNSRINQNLRERNGFTYGARSYFDARKQSGAFVVSTEVRTEVTAAATLEIAQELRHICDTPVGPGELETVQNYIIGSFPLSLETPQQIASRVAALVLYGLDTDYYDKFRDAVASTTADDLLRAAGLHLQPEALTIAISGDATSLAPELKSFGEVELVPLW
ncbi:MAG TPA: pitrilysin family protein [Candidatus Kapabacteria bacterium]|nr:pitrilysin family protein [Candidatus Kapabacteria bacterium]